MIFFFRYDAEMCAECQTVTDDGEFDLDDGNWYCLGCWAAMEDDPSCHQQDVAVKAARAFPEPTPGEVRHLASFAPDIAHRLIVAMYPSQVDYDEDERLGLNEDLKMAELLATKEDMTGRRVADGGEPPDQLERRGTMSQLPLESKEGAGKYMSLPDSVIEAGWLEKRGGGTSRLGNTRYKRRWFELVRTTTGVYLTYQNEPKDGLLKGAIEMQSVWLQNDPAKMLSMHEVSERPNKRVFRLKAPTLPEKNCWLKALNSQLIRPEELTTVIKTKSIPDVAGWLTLQKNQPPKRGTSKLQWCELWIQKGVLSLFDSATQSSPNLNIKMADAAVVNDTADEVNSFSMMVGPVEYRFDQPYSAKDKWLEPIVPLTTIGILMEKNSGRKVQLTRADDGTPGGPTRQDTSTFC